MGLDKLTLTQLLEKLKRELNKLERMDFDLGELETDEDIQDLVNRRMQVAIEICIDMAVMIAAGRQLPRQEEAADVFRELARAGLLESDLAERLVGATGFRNILVHEYTDIDYGKVYEYKTGRLDDLRNFAVQVEKIFRSV